MITAATAKAHANIALAKYWGKADAARNLPAVPSLSLTLDAMSTLTTVTFDSSFENDQLILGGVTVPPDQARKAASLLDRLRRIAGVELRARIETANDFPTASGLASSASGFAALALAASAALGIRSTPAEISDQARQASASAARSLFGGFVTLAAGASGQAFLSAEPLDDARNWDIAISVVMTTLGKKDVGSTDGMSHTAKTSPFYPAWVDLSQTLFDKARRAVLARDLDQLGEIAEQSAFSMHASAMAAAPAVVYFSSTTLAVIEQVRKLRKAGVSAYVTMDAGPHVKVLSSGRDAAMLRETLGAVQGVEKVLIARPGPAASIISSGQVT